MFKFEGKRGIDSEDSQSGQEKEFSDAFSAHGSYTLNLQLQLDSLNSFLFIPYPLPLIIFIAQAPPLYQNLI